MDALFTHRRGLLDRAVSALWRARILVAASRRFPAERSTARTHARTGSPPTRRIGTDFVLEDHPEFGRAGAEVITLGAALDITIRRRTQGLLVAASEERAPPGGRGPEVRVGLLIEALMRLNARSFEMANAVMHTTGQAFPMAFQAGGPHAQDRGLEAVAMAWAEMSRIPATARWEKPQGKAAPMSSRSTGASCRAAWHLRSAARPFRPGTAIPACSRASPPATR